LVVKFIDFDFVSQRFVWTDRKSRELFVCNLYLMICL